MRTPRVIVYTCIVVMVDKKALKNTNTHYIHTRQEIEPKTEEKEQQENRKKPKKKTDARKQEKVVTLTIAQEKKIAVRLFDIACSTRETEERREKVR